MEQASVSTLVSNTLVVVKPSSTNDGSLTSGQCAVLRVERSWFETRAGHCVVFLVKTLYSQSAALSTQSINEYCRLSGKPDEMLGGTLAMD